MGVHDGHRRRMKERFESFGLDNFADVNVLELLLFYAVPRRDTNETAHRLLGAFGSLSNVLEADIGLLTQVEGVGHETAVYLRLIGEVARRKDMQPVKRGQKVDSINDAVNILRPLFKGVTVERAYMLMLDGYGRMAGCELLDEGAPNKVKLDYGKIMRSVYGRQAKAVVLAHNHVNSPATPSIQDIEATKQLSELLNKAGVQLLDHVIFSGNFYCSMKDVGALR